jgi:Ni/Co efflux regulator RcnB
VRIKDRDDRGRDRQMQPRGQQDRHDDWRGQHLSAPPRAYHWVQTGADFVLVAGAASC